MKVTTSKNGVSRTQVGFRIPIDLYNNLLEEASHKSLSMRAILERILQKHYEKK